MATPLIKRFYQDRYLHVRSFTLTLLAMGAISWWLYHILPDSHYVFSPEPWHALLVVFGVYMGGISAVWIHNACHGSFKNPWVNAACGYIAGIHQLWGFLGWKFVHLLHHMYSDDPERDTHSPKGMTIWQFGKTMFTHSSLVVSKRYLEHWGDTRQTYLLQKIARGMLFSMGLVNLIFWHALLGADGFVFFYIPSYIANYLLFVDINYSAHPADPATGDTKPANLSDTPYQKLANAIWFGIYFHANHHRKPLAFNPRYISSI